MGVARTAQTATLLRDGRVLIAGGSSKAWGGPSLASAEVYDPRTGKFTPTGSMHLARAGHTSTRLADGRVLVAGGYASWAGPASGLFYVGPALASAELYDPATGTFSLTGPMAHGREDHAAVLLADGRVLVSGGLGCDVGGCGSAVMMSEMYDPRRGTFSPAGNEWANMAIALADGRVVATGLCNDASASLYDPSAGPSAAWSSSAPFDSPGSYGGACGTLTLLANGQALLAGGAWADPLSSGIKKAASLYDPESGRFYPTGSMLAARGRQTATLLADGRVLVAGGGDARPCGKGSCVGAILSEAELYDPITGTFALARPMAARRFDHTATLLSDGRVLIAGGYGGAAGGASLASVEVYDPAARPSPLPSPTPSWGTLKSAGVLFSARGDASAAILDDGRVLLAGGDYSGLLVGQSGAPIVTASAELYDPAAGVFVGTGSMSTPRVWSTATLLNDGRVLVAGGTADDATGVALASAELYNPSTGDFTPTGSMTTPRAGHTATRLHDGRVVIVGGRMDSSGLADLASAEIYDPSTGLFTATGSMAAARSFQSAILLADGRVLVSGGWRNYRSQTTVEFYDLQKGNFDPGAPLAMPGGGSTATLLPNGVVLVAGGGMGASPAELYDPETGKSTVLAPMVVGLSGGSAVLLRSGRVLLAGGNSIELFDPSTRTFTFAGWTDGRSGAAVVGLMNGSVLIAGGSGDQALTATLYQP
jgi:large repetitive protein